MDKFGMEQLDRSILELRICFHVALSKHFGIKPDLDLIKTTIETQNDKDMFETIKRNDAAAKKASIGRKQRSIFTVFSKNIQGFNKLRSFIGLRRKNKDRVGS
jgi:hypothetical protein